MLKISMILIICLLILLIIVYKISKKRKYDDLFDNLNKLENDDKILIMYSGGLDSVYLTYKLIEKLKILNKYPKLIVHHIKLIDKTKRWEAELIASNNSINYFKKLYNNIYYFESEYNFPIPDSKVQRDNEIVSFIMGQIISTFNYYDTSKIKGIITGTTIFDNEIDEYFKYLKIADFYKNLGNKTYIPEKDIYVSCKFGIDEIKEHDKKYNISEEEYNKIKLFFDDNKEKYQLSNFDKIVEFYKLKKIIYNKLPKKLKKNYSSCRFPNIENNRIEQCNKCINCYLKKIYIEYI